MMESNHPNVTPIRDEFFLTQLLIGAHFAPMALQLSLWREELIWTALTAVLAIMIFLSSGFRYIFPREKIVRISVCANAAAQLFALAGTTVLSASWPAAFGIIVGLTTAGLSILWSESVARAYNIPKHAPVGQPRK